MGDIPSIALARFFQPHVEYTISHALALHQMLWLLAFV